MRRDLLFIFNFNPVQSFTDYGLLVKEGKYKVVLNTDAALFGGYEQVDERVEYQAIIDPLYAATKKGWLKLYLPARSALVLKRKPL